MTRPRSIPVEDLALAYELRQHFGMRWKAIARHLGYDPQALNCAVWRAVRYGLRAGYEHHRRTGASA